MRCSRFVNRLRALAEVEICPNSEHRKTSIVAAHDTMRGMVIAFESILSSINDVRALSKDVECICATVEDRIKDWVSKTEDIASQPKVNIEANGIHNAVYSI